MTGVAVSGLAQCRGLIDDGRYREAAASIDDVVAGLSGESRLEGLALQAELRRREGRFDDAIASLEACHETATELGNTRAQAEALMEAGRLHLVMGQPARALQTLQKVMAMPATPLLKVTLHFAVSEAFAHSGNIPKAEHMSGSAAWIAEHEVPEAETGGLAFLRLMAERRIALARLAEHQHQYRRALYVLDGIDNNARLALGRRDNADAHEALRLHSERLAPTLDLIRGRLLLRLGEDEQAGELLKRAREAAMRRGDMPIAVEAEGWLGRIEIVSRRWPEAVELLHSAVDRVEQWLADIEVEEYRAALRLQVAEIYSDLILAAHNGGDRELTWRTVEQSRAREFLAALHASPTDATSLGPDFDRLADLDRRIAEVSGRMIEATPGTPAFGRLREERKSLSNDKVRHLEDMRSVPRHRAVVHVLEESWSRIASLIGDETAFVQFHFGTHQLMVFVIVDGQFMSRAFDVHPDAVERRTRRFLRELKRPPEERARDDWRRLARQLHDGVWGLVTPLLAHKPRICIVPHGPLLDLPFSALLAEGDVPLLARMEIVYAPSASILSAVADASQPSIERVAVFADPLPAGRWALPGTQLEAESISRTKLDVRLASGEAATAAAVLEASRSADALHLACHVEFDAEHPMLSALLLASPDGRPDRLEVHSIYRNQTTARLVVMSGCQGAVAERDAGAEIQGLVRAFMVSGASTVVGSQWKVDDDATARLMGTMYDALADGVSPAAALRIGQLDLATSREYADPYFWAAFGPHGDWR